MKKIFNLFNKKRKNLEIIGEKEITPFMLFDSSQTNFRTKEWVQMRKSFTKGSFDVSGYYHLPNYIKKLYKKIQIDDIVELIPDPNNKHDNEAIVVSWNNKHIGWVALVRQQNKYKSDVFQSLIKNEKVISRIRTTQSRENGQYWDMRIDIIFPKPQ